MTYWNLFLGFVRMEMWSKFYVTKWYWFHGLNCQYLGEWQQCFWSDCFNPNWMTCLFRGMVISSWVYSYLTYPPNFMWLSETSFGRWIIIFGSKDKSIKQVRLWKTDGNHLKQTVQAKIEGILQFFKHWLLRLFWRTSKLYACLPNAMLFGQTGYSGTITPPPTPTNKNKKRKVKFEAPHRCPHQTKFSPICICLQNLATIWNSWKWFVTDSHAHQLLRFHLKCWDSRKREPRDSWRL